MDKQLPVDRSETKIDNKAAVECLTNAYKAWTTAYVGWQKNDDKAYEHRKRWAYEALYDRIRVYSDDVLAAAVPELKNVVNETKGMVSSLIGHIRLEAIALGLRKTHQACLEHEICNYACTLYDAAKDNKCWAVEQILAANKGKWAVCDICDAMRKTDDAEILKLLRTVRDGECVNLNNAYGREMEARLPKDERAWITRWCDK